MENHVLEFKKLSKQFKQHGRLVKLWNAVYLIAGVIKPLREKAVIKMLYHTSECDKLLTKERELLGRQFQDLINSLKVE